MGHTRWIVGLMLVAAVAMIALVTARAQGAGAGAAYSFKSRFYEVTTDLERDEARKIVSHMDLVYGEYQRRLSKFPVKNAKPIKMYLWETPEGYMEFLSGKGIDGTNSGGMFFVTGDGDSGLTTFVRGQEGSRMLHVLQHEGFHQFAHLRIGDTLPVWANEGLAEYFGHGVMVAGKLKLGVMPASELEAFKGAHESDHAFSVGEMMGMDGGQWNQRLRTDAVRGGLQYQYAWMLTHFLVEADGGKYARAFEEYLVMIAQGRDHAQAFGQAFGATDYDAMQRAFEKFLASAEADELSTAQERLEFIGEGLKFLHGKGAPPASIEELKTRLRAARFEVKRTSHGVERRLRATDDSLFEAPGSGNAKKPAAMEWIAPKDETLPPGVRITGLKARVELVWETGGEGAPVYRVEFR